MKTREFDLNVAVRGTRKDFTRDALNESDVDRDPFLQFNAWLDQAFKSGNEMANAMVLSTADSEGMPSSRVMLLRDISNGGFTFFTNYQSRKARDLRQNAKAALLFFWPDLERQVRVQGEIQYLPERESDLYFKSRPFESRVGAWASAQSCVVGSREQLEHRFEKALALYKEREVPRPVNWGGYVLIPECFEFWQGRANRLHDRLQFRLDKRTGNWIMERLMP